MSPSALSKPIYHNAIRYLGDSGTNNAILRRRRWTMQTMRRLGTPVLIKHMFNIDDVNAGIATLSPNLDTIYDQSIHKDPLSYGVGYVSVETTEEEWIKPATEREQAELVIGPFQDEFEPAPTYRGYGPGYLTYVLLPDAPTDVFKLTDEGALIKTQEARVQLPWNPEVGDNDLLIVVELDGAERIIGTRERYQLKKVNPITMRGQDRWGRPELGSEITASGNRWLVGQYCEANKVPEGTDNPLYEVECDR